MTMSTVEPDTAEGKQVRSKAAAAAAAAFTGYRVPLISARASRAGTWALTGLLILGTLINLASPSGWEHFLQAPLAAVLAALCLIVARSHPHATSPQNQGRREL